MISQTVYTLDSLIAEYEQLFMAGGIQQAHEELSQLVDYVGDRRFKRMCEVGIADGGTIWLYAHLFGALGGKFIVTDMHIRPITRRVMEAVTERTGITFEVHECKNYQFRLASVTDEKVEFLHLDGDHSYNAIMWDYHQNKDMVSDGGMIVVHDTLLMEGPIKFRLDVEAELGERVRTFRGVKTLCDCFGPGRVNPQRRAFGMTVIDVVD